MKAIRGLNGPCKIVYDRWYKNRQKSVSFSGHISDGLCMVSVKAESFKGNVAERVRSLAPRGMENLVTEVTSSAKRHPRSTLPLASSIDKNRETKLARDTSIHRTILKFLLLH